MKPELFPVSNHRCGDVSKRNKKTYTSVLSNTLFICCICCIIWPRLCW